MLTILHHLPDGLLDSGAADLHRILEGPTLIHLSGRRQPALFVSVLLHGNEDTGWLAARELLLRQGRRELPRALSLFIGNVAAARSGVRRLDGQPDYNRIWTGGETAEHRMASGVLREMSGRGVFASVDVHNNTGLNPHYACVNDLQPAYLQLATLFSRTVVYFTRPASVQSMAFARLCPAVTLECGQPGQQHGVDHALEYLEACLNLSEVPLHPVAEHDLDLFHTIATVKVPPHLSFSYRDEKVDLRLARDLDRLNFRELPAQTPFARLRPGCGAAFEVTDEEGRDAFPRLFRVVDEEVRTRIPVMPAMLTLDERIIRQDCLCYLMERYPRSPAPGGEATSPA